MVTTDKGRTPISDITVGDFALAFNESTGTIGYYKVTAVMKHADLVLVTLMVNGESIVTTPEHPFYITGQGWIPAGALQVGEKILRANGQVGTVKRIAVTKQLQVMYNLTVADAHTFFVGDGQWLVHNECRKVLQTGGNTLDKGTLKELGLSKQQGKQAIESLKADLGFRNDFHAKIWSNGDVTHPKTGEVLGNLFDYVD